ncbi:4a-hydroxytetrahydrobiopterin dehydratase [Vannielia litorea]|uniref:4a-hydroxytetrahydrobiopterin dehydratase n=1 Tax=Vannielia litorea TaxID=1217970 RepID=UPI001C945FB5|nr:4a-hydroxytetrahydrobiopterin dehydratase [Vannielia litorea]MBY6049887.1 4a-hydroxytetrahydrobiopterin dehydratase [Vannielia litorea]MBY6077301.1 4a-hydroxytetrahydrobiopterin dehydratase [Vannielia litorea]
MTLEELEAAGWARDGEVLAKTFKFRNFSEAFGWMARVALAAEKADHHPDWSNSWNKVEVRLTTHSAGALTEKDLKLASVMEKLAG